MAEANLLLPQMRLLAGGMSAAYDATQHVLHTGDRAGRDYQREVNIADK